jgi:hypothetical protein
MKTNALLFLMLLLASLPGVQVRAFDDAPPVSITSPDQATTYSLNSIRTHELVWDDKRQLLIAHVVFVPLDSDGGPADEDAHDFRLPGVRFDRATGLFSAVSSKGDIIPVARMKKTLFLKTIETLPNAIVRIQNHRGQVGVVMEAVRADSPALRAPLEADQPHTIDVKQIFRTN